MALESPMAIGAGETIMPYELQPFDVDVETTPYVRAPEGGAGEGAASKTAGGGDRWTLNFGPQHPATHTTLRMVLELDGERVVRATPHIGYLHSGFEKLAEHLNYNQYVTIVSRMNYISPAANDICWHGAVEKLFGIDLTPRCKVVRTILAELARISDHLLCVGAAALDLGALTAFLYGFNERERINDIMEYVCGQRFHTDNTRVGGMMYDLPDEQMFKKMVKKFIAEQCPPAVEDMVKLLNRNRIFRERTEGIGAISREDAIAWSLSGPVARACGVRRDLRKDEPYLCYADNWDGQGARAVKFQVPVASGGDALGRYLVRVEEIRQSLAIIGQLIDNIPGGPIDNSPQGKAVLPEKSQVYGSIEGLIQQFEMVMWNRGWQAPTGEAYAANETANGELGFYIVGDGTPVAWRAKCRPPSFINFQVFAKMIEGHMLSDAVAILGSLNIIAAELDR
jgi:NADH-quinone oxidoreductase subunit D